MSGEEFLLTQRMIEIEQQFVDKGWVTIYQGVGGTEKDLIYCCLVKNKYAGKYMKDRNWGIESGREGRPAVYGSLGNEDNKETYKSYDKKNVEPFLFYRHFSHIDQAYVDEAWLCKTNLQKNQRAPCLQGNLTITFWK